MPEKQTYYVFIQRGGFAEVEATSAEEAMEIVNATYRTDDVYWDDDWECVDAQLADLR